MPPLASLAASLLVASPPLAACGPPARFRHGGGGPAYPQPILSLPSAYPRILSHPARGDGGGGDAAAGVLCSMLIVPLGLRAPHTHSWPRRPWRPAPPHTASQAKPAARSLAKLPGAAPLGAAAARPSAGNAATAPVRSTADRWCKSMVTLALGQGPEPKTGPTHQVQVVPLRKWMPEAPGSQPTGSEHEEPSPVSVDDNNLIYAQLMLHEHSSMWSESHTRYQDDTGSSKRLWLGSSARPPAAALPGPPAPAGPP